MFSSLTKTEVVNVYRAPKQKVETRNSHVVFIIDTSSSMSSFSDKVLKGVKKVYDTLPEECGVSVYTFANEYNLLLKRNQKKFVNWDKFVQDYKSNVRNGGCTKLYSTIVEAINQVDYKIRKTNNIFFICFSDGADNHSSISSKDCADNVINILFNGMSYSYFYFISYAYSGDLKKIKHPKYKYYDCDNVHKIELFFETVRQNISNIISIKKTQTISIRGNHHSMTNTQTMINNTNFNRKALLNQISNMNLNNNNDQLLLTNKTSKENVKSCKFGKKCRNITNGKCSYKHTCKFGNDCRLKVSECNFIH